MSVESFFNNRSRQYSRNCDTGAWGWVKRGERAEIIGALNPQARDRVLDLGCGDGYYSGLLFNKYGCKLMAIDSSAPMLDELSAQHPGIQNIQMDCQKLPKLGVFDKILAAGVLEFVESPGKVFQKCDLNLSEKGKVVLLVPRPGWIGFLYKIIHKFSGCPVYLRSMDEYKGLAQANGFCVKKIRGRLLLSVVLELERQ